jgi:hypothetical protein
MRFSSTISVLLAIVHAVVGDELDSSLALAEDDRLHKHDGSFQPDFYLSVTYENHTVACQHRMSVLVNGTSPGPTLRLTPGKTSWVRVCNNMDMYNTTMVRHLKASLHKFRMLTERSTGMALPSGQHLLVTARQSVSGQLRRIDASIMRSIRRSRILGPTSTTPMSVSRPLPRLDP